jgi:hypothetical protein
MASERNHTDMVISLDSRLVNTANRKLFSPPMLPTPNSQRVNGYRPDTGQTENPKLSENVVQSRTSYYFEVLLGLSVAYLAENSRSLPRQALLVFNLHCRTRLTVSFMSCTEVSRLVNHSSPMQYPHLWQSPMSIATPLHLTLF